MILICQCKQAGLIDQDRLKTICDELDGAGVSYTAADDLCGLAAGKHAIFKECRDASDLMILACYPRAIEALFKAAGASLPDNVQIENLRAAADVEAVLEQVSKTQPGKTEQIQALKEWIPWFPVIDYQRCTNCKQCLSFCLFGVYEKDASGQVRVVRPDQCKTNCPACARVCPFAAIIFPKYNESPIRGDAVDEQAWKQRDIPEALQQRLEGNIYAMLRNRSQSAAVDIEDLKKMQKRLGIPDDVIKTLQKPIQKPETSS